MAYNKFPWADRISPYPNRRKLTLVSGTTDVYDITREEGDPSQITEGTPLNFTTLDALEDRLVNMNTTLFGVMISPVTLPVNGWSSASGMDGYLINVTVNGVTATSNQEILPMPATSSTNIDNNKALQEANIMDYGQSSGQITLYAENLPETDLYVRVLLRT